MNQLYVLTAVHNDLTNLKQLLTCLAKQKYQNFQIVVVDDGSTDGTGNYLKQHYPQVKVITGSGNLWWTGSLNIGIQYILQHASGNDYILTINNDCQIDESYLAQISKYAKEKMVVGSKIIDQKTGKLWDLGVMIDWSRGKIAGRTKSSDPLDAITTKGTLYPVSMFHHIGLLSHHLPHYISDYELTIRAKRLGYTLVVRDDCVVTNDVRNTGIGDSLSETISLKQSLELMFDRRSKLNIIDQFWFITLACPARFRTINYLRLILKTAYLLTLPFPGVHKLLKRIKAQYNH